MCVGRVPIVHSRRALSRQTQAYAARFRWQKSLDPGGHLETCRRRLHSTPILKQSPSPPAVEKSVLVKATRIWERDEDVPGPSPPGVTNGMVSSKSHQHRSRHAKATRPSDNIDWCPQPLPNDALHRAQKPKELDRTFSTNLGDMDNIADVQLPDEERTNASSKDALVEDTATESLQQPMKSNQIEERNQELAFKLLRNAIADQNNYKSDVSDNTSNQMRTNTNHLQYLHEGDVYDSFLTPTDISDRRKESSKGPEEDFRTYRIHILGNGPLGVFLAHHLARLPFGPKVTILLHKVSLIRAWYDEGAITRFHSHDEAYEESNGIDVESCVVTNNVSKLGSLRYGPNEETSAMPPDYIIDCLIVTTPSQYTISALRNVQHRLRPSSTICLVNDVLGLMEHINREFFNEPKTRPYYMLGNLSHVLTESKHFFSVRQRREGVMHLVIPPYQYHASLPEEEGTPQFTVRTGLVWPDSGRYLVKTLCRSPGLRAIGLRYSTFLCNFLTQFTINAILGPLSVLFDCKNEQLLFNPQVSDIMVMLAEEIIAIIKSLPELHPEDSLHFEVAKLITQVTCTIGRTGGYFTAMHLEASRGNRTEITYLNGYLVRRAVELGIPCPVNLMLVKVVEGRSLIRKRQMHDVIPFEAS